MNFHASGYLADSREEFIITRKGTQDDRKTIPVNSGMHFDRAWRLV